MKKNAIISFCLIILLLIVSVFAYNNYTNYINTRTNDIRTVKLKDLDRKDFILSRKDYIEDFNFAYDVLKNHYPFFEVNKKLYGIDWLNNKEKYEAYIAESKNDISYYSNPKCTWRHDIAKIYEKDDVRRRYNINNEAIENVINQYIKSDDEVNKTYSKNLMTENIIKDKLAYIRISSLIGMEYINQDRDIVINYLNEIKDYPFLIIDIRGNGGGDSRYWAYFLLPNIIDKKYETKNYLLIKSGELNKKIFEQFNFNKDVKTFLDKSSFSRDVKDILKDFDGYLAFDSIIEPSEDSIHYKGKIYLLVDNGVYSSAEMLASFCKETNQTVPDIIVQESEEDKTGYLENQKIIKAVMRDAGLSK